MNKTKTIFLLFLVLTLCLSTLPLAYADVLIDSYAEGNETSAEGIKGVHPSGSTYSAIGQCFRITGAWIPTACKFKMYKGGLPVGNLRAAITSMTGTFGSSGIPTGSILVDSDDVAMAGLPVYAGRAMINFTFSTPTVITAGDYCLWVYAHDASTLGGSDEVGVMYHVAAGTHNGNYFEYFAGAWNPQANDDTVFYLYGDPAVYDIDIEVENSNGDPMEGAYGYLNNSHSGYTDANGVLNFTDVESGAYLLTIEKSCYHTYTVEINLTEDTEIEVTLQGGPSEMVLYLMVALAMGLAAFGFIAKIQGDIPKTLTVLICSISGVVMLVVFLWVFFTCIGI